MDERGRRERSRAFYARALPLRRAVGNGAILLTAMLLEWAHPLATERERVGGLVGIVVFTALATVLQRALVLRDHPWGRAPMMSADYLVFGAAIVATGGAESLMFWLPLSRLGDAPFVHPRMRRLFVVLGPLTFAVAALAADGAAALTPLLGAQLFMLTGWSLHVAANQAPGFDNRMRLEKQNQTLRQLAVEANSAAEAKGAFLAAMSHEMRTPVNGILGSVDLLDVRGLGPEARELVDVVRVSSEALLGLINDVLDLSRLEAGELRLEESAGSPRQLAEEVIGILTPAARASAVKLRAEVDPAVPPFIRTDPTRFRQILLNLASNAVKFTPAGEVSLRIGPAGEGTMRIDVVDTGIGMTQEVMDRVFQSFTQAESGTTRRYGGTGLGLAMTRRLTELLGGTITVRSELGVGSTFSVVLPMRPAEPAATAPSSVPAEAESETELPGMSVLVVDDNPVNRMVAGRLLERMGLSVEMAVDGARAVEAVELGAFDLVLMDVSMPVMDGLEATRRIRTLHPEARPLIIALTANAFESDRERCFEAGMDGFLSKPVRKQALAAEIRRQLAKAPPRS